MGPTRRRGRWTCRRLRASASAAHASDGVAAAVSGHASPGAVPPLPAPLRRLLRFPPSTQASRASSQWLHRMVWWGEGRLLRGGGEGVGTPCPGRVRAAGGGGGGRKGGGHGNPAWWQRFVLYIQLWTEEVVPRGEGASQPPVGTAPRSRPPITCRPRAEMGTRRSPSPACRDIPKKQETQGRWGRGLGPRAWTQHNGGKRQNHNTVAKKKKHSKTREAAVNSSLRSVRRHANTRGQDAIASTAGACASAACAAAAASCGACAPVLP